MSSINPNNIDGTYPIAGQDNDSQGFRDNFTNIKNNLTFAKTEIEDVQAKGIFKTALSGTTLDNELNGTIISGAQLLKARKKINELGPLSGTVTVDWADAHFQTLILGTGNITLALTGWPTSGTWTNLTLEVNVTNVSYTLTLPTDVTIGYGGIAGISGRTISFASTGTYLFEFSTYDNGETITVRDLLRNYSTGFTSNTAELVTANIIGGGNALTVNYGISANGHVYIGNTLNVGSATTITGNLNVGGVTTFAGNIASANVTGNLNVGGVTTFAGNIASANVTGNLNVNYLNTTTGVTSSSTIRITSATGKLGYNSGNTVTQGTNKYTSVTLNSVTGTITMVNTAMANGNIATFTLTNNVIESTDYILVQHQSGGTVGAYACTASPGSSSAQIRVTNISQAVGSLSEAIVLRYVVIKSSDS
jgi:hypothetical protein